MARRVICKMEGLFLLFIFNVVMKWFTEWSGIFFKGKSGIGKKIENTRGSWWDIQISWKVVEGGITARKVEEH